jgi:hypothetical protein
LFTAKKTPDVYITPMMMGGDVKISLHKSGSWQAGLTSEGFAKLPRTSSRHWDIWPREEKADVGPGITRAWYLVLPDQELRPGREAPEAYKLPPVGPGHAASVEVLLVANEGTEIVIDDAHIVGRWPLAGRDESCLLAVRRIPWTEERQARAIARKEEFAAQMKAAGVTESDDYAYLIHGHNAEGVRFALELTP